MAGYLPPVGFHFRVEVLGLPPLANDMRFTEVSGLSVEIATEEVAEGGENRFTHRYPLRPKYPELVVKRGLLTHSEVFNWVKDCVDGDVIAPRNIDVGLLNENHEPLLTWHVVRAFPTKWVVSDLNATNNAVVIETLQFSYQYFTLDRL